MKNIIIIMLITACASVAANWIDKTPKYESLQWRICHKSIDDDKKHLKGFCYISKECKSRRFRSNLCRKKELFCAFDNVSCVERAARQYRLMTSPSI